MGDTGDEWAVDESLRLLVDSTTDYAIFALDPDGIVRTWNAGAQSIKGYEADEIIGRHFSAFYPVEAINRRLPAHELEVATASGKYQEEGWRLRKDGSQFWASVTITALRDSNGTLRGFGKVTRDLTDRKRQEESLRKAEESFRLAFDVAPTGMALASIDGKWLRVNESLCHTLQRSAEELASTTVGEVLGLSATAYSPWFEPLLSAAAHRRDLRIERPDGQLVWIQATAGLVYDDARQPSHLVVHVENVTTRTLAAQKLEEAEKAKSQFVALTSHELRTPLTSIRGFADLLTRRWDAISEDRRRESVENIGRQARRLQALVEDLLILSTIDSEGLRLSLESLPIASLVTEVAADLAVQLEVTGDRDLLVAADPLRITQVLSNLLSNAEKYGRAPYVVHLDSTPTRTVISLQDGGDGVPVEFVPLMFDRFTQADDGIDRRSQGTGLGLSICKALAEAHGGELTYQSGDAGGARFVLSLPRP